MKSPRLTLFLLLCLICGSVLACGETSSRILSVESRLELPSIFSDHMMLQAGRPSRIWGQAVAGAPITVELVRDRDGAIIIKKETQSHSDGSWQIEFDALSPSYETYRLSIRSMNKTIDLSDVLIGEIWLSSGQSNMELQLQNSLDGADFIMQADDPHIRIFSQDHIGPKMALFTSSTPLFDVEGGRWVRADRPNQVASASAISYHFARQLRQLLREQGREVPVGIVQTAMGSTAAASWMSRETLSRDSELSKLVPTVWQTTPSVGQAKPYLQPTAAYNHKLAPLIPFSLRGFIWTQGESNIGGEERARLYQRTLNSLITSWRESWGFEDMPFILSTLQAAPTLCTSAANLDNYAFTREAQESVANELPWTRAIPIHDIDPVWDVGSWKYTHPVHPLAKAQVGERMARSAWSLVYDGTSRYEAPRMESVQWKDGRALVTFHDSGAPLQNLRPGSSLLGFALADKARVYYPAEARILSERVVEVWNPALRDPVAVSYAFTQMNREANLGQTLGLPAFPFRSDRAPSTFVRIRPQFVYDLDRQAFGNLTPDLERSIIPKEGAPSEKSLQLKSSQTEFEIEFRIKVTFEGKYTFSVQVYSPNPGLVLEALLDDQILSAQTLNTEGWHQVTLAVDQALTVDMHRLRFKVRSQDPTPSILIGLDRLFLEPNCPDDPSLRRTWSL